jgi:hypothetical protein
LESGITFRARVLPFSLLSSLLEESVLLLVVELLEGE